MTEDTSPRRLLVTALAAALPAWEITGYPVIPDAVTRPTVMVWTSSLEPALQVGRDRIRAELDVWVLTGITVPGKADDALDAQLVDVLEVLHGLEWLDWTRAERGTLNDTFHGFRVSAVAALKIGDN